MSNKHGNKSVSQCDESLSLILRSPQSITAPGSVRATGVQSARLTPLRRLSSTSYLGCHVVRKTASWLTTNLYLSTRIAANFRMGSMLWRIYEIKAIEQINSVFAVVHTDLKVAQKGVQNYPRVPPCRFEIQILKAKGCFGKYYCWYGRV